MPWPLLHSLTLLVLCQLGRVGGLACLITLVMGRQEREENVRLDVISCFTCLLKVRCSYPRGRHGTKLHEQAHRNDRCLFPSVPPGHIGAPEPPHTQQLVSVLGPLSRGKLALKKGGGRGTPLRGGASWVVPLDHRVRPWYAGLGPVGLAKDTSLGIP